MAQFEIITEDMYYSDNFNLDNHIVNKIKYAIDGNVADYRYDLETGIIDCESPIEQLLAIELKKINLEMIVKYNPFIDVMGIGKNEYVECGSKKYRVDFLIPVIYKNQEELCYVIECDGHEFHQKTKEQVEYDNERQRNLQKYGYEVIRFSGTEIWHKPYQCACSIKNIILSKCKYIGDNNGNKENS